MALDASYYPLTIAGYVLSASSLRSSPPALRRSPSSFSHLHGPEDGVLCLEVRGAQGRGRGGLVKVATSAEKANDIVSATSALRSALVAHCRFAPRRSLRLLTWSATCISTALTARNILYALTTLFHRPSSV